MKHAIFSLFLLSYSSLLYGQASVYEDSLKHYKGARSIEVLFAPVRVAPVSIWGIRFRTFNLENAAVRVNAYLGISRDTDKALVTDATGKEVTFRESKGSFTLELRPGIESHFGGTRRLSVYWGAEAVVGLHTSAGRSQTFDADGTTILVNKVKNPENDGYFRIGANALLGSDFYFAKNIYFGTEIGFGLLLDLNLDEVTLPEDGDRAVTSAGGSSFFLGPNSVGRLRLGFLF